jgi:hypothetical protein
MKTFSLAWRASATAHWKDLSMPLSDDGMVGALRRPNFDAFQAKR